MRRLVLWLSVFALIAAAAWYVAVAAGVERIVGIAFQILLILVAASYLTRTFRD